jgi:salicylate hydroxylase
LTAALALARNGFRAIVLEQAERLEETGAGIQLSPNATHALIALGLGERLRPHAVTPLALRVLNAKSGREIVHMPLGEAAAQRYGAPYWSIHRGDLQAALAAAAGSELDISLRLGMRVEDFAVHGGGVTVSARSRSGVWHERGDLLLAADGLWSAIRARLGFREPPRFAGRVAWRALIPAAEAAPEFRTPLVHLWLGRAAHVVHYPVKAGAAINVVVIMNDSWSTPERWSEPATRDDLVPRLSGARVAPAVLSLIDRPHAWLKWALFDRAPLTSWSRGPVALIGDAAHPMLPYLAQGAAMGIEDAVVAAQCLAGMPNDAAAGLRAYGAVRRPRTSKVQRLAARNGGRYHLGGIGAALRDATMRAIGGARLLQHYDWLYDWRPPRSIT